MLGMLWCLLEQQVQHFVMAKWETLNTENSCSNAIIFARFTKMSTQIDQRDRGSERGRHSHKTLQMKSYMRECEIWQDMKMDIVRYAQCNNTAISALGIYLTRKKVSPHCYDHKRFHCYWDMSGILYKCINSIKQGICFYLWFATHLQFAYTIYKRFSYVCWRTNTCRMVGYYEMICQPFIVALRFNFDLRPGFNLCFNHDFQIKYSFTSSKWPNCFSCVRSVCL